MEYPIGSEWRRWDLHVHTPCSLVQHYGGDEEAAWEQFFADIEALPQSFAVLGINDYLFIDGYRKVLAAKASGRLKNIDLIVPVIELRIDKFGGTEGHLKRVNLHVIFSNQIHPDIVQEQFLSALNSNYVLSPHHEDLNWNEVPTRQSLTTLGEMIIESVPSHLRHQYGSPIVEGFNNLNLNFDFVLDILERPQFKNRHLTAVGKTEWEAIQWNNHTIADKKSLINRVDLVFTASQSPDHAVRAREKLAENNVNARLLDCSDAHHFSGSNDKDRLGHCYTWIKADPTFEGLVIASKEYEERIALTDKPDKLASVERNPTRYIRSLSIDKIGLPVEDWFGGETVEFNSGLVAIIGNKGSGKSALLDILGLLGNSYNFIHASFLNRKRFNQQRNVRGSSFQAHLNWADGSVVERKLDEAVEPEQIPVLRYIPQNFFENICNEITGTEAGEFDKELKAVIFDHVPSADRLGMGSLEELIEYTTSELTAAVDHLRSNLSRLNEQILAYENMLSDQYKLELENQLALKEQELQAHRNAKPEAISKPDDGDPALKAQIDAIEAQKEELRTLATEKQDRLNSQANIARRVAQANRAGSKLELFQKQYDAFCVDVSTELTPLSIALEDVIRLSINKNPLEALLATLNSEREDVEKELDATHEGSVAQRESELTLTIETQQSRLDEPNRKYQGYEKALEEWTKRELQLQGDQDTVGTIAYIAGCISRLNEIPELLNEAETRRLQATEGIFDKLSELRDKFGEFYRPVQNFIDNDPIARSHLKLDFDTKILNTSFKDRFFGFVHSGRQGSYYGVDTAEARVKATLDKYDFNVKSDVLGFVQEIIDSLRYDRRRSDDHAVNVSAQIRQNQSLQNFYDFLFGLEYLEPKYMLRLDNKPIEQLSPGEKGALLLVFYLLVDSSSIPLLIDQPDDNLDNQTIVALLVPGIKKAKKGRQIFIVTHNPNIAVVCDAEQIIYAEHKAEERYKIGYSSGSIECGPINKNAQDVLEGTKRAFDIRGNKYLNV